MLPGVRFLTPPWSDLDDSLLACLRVALLETSIADALDGATPISLAGLTALAQKDLRLLTRTPPDIPDIDAGRLAEVSVRRLLDNPGWGELRAIRMIHSLVISAVSSLTDLVPSRGGNTSWQDRLEWDLQFRLLYLAGQPWEPYVEDMGVSVDRALTTCPRLFRDLEVARLRLTGLSLRQAGAKVKPRISGERVRVICSGLAQTLPSIVSKDLLDPRRLSKRHIEASASVVRRKVIQEPGISWPELATMTGLDPATLVAFLGPQGRKFVRGAPSPRRVRGKVWSNEDILTALRNAATYAYPLRAQDYDELLSENAILGPKAQSVMLRFGGWREACDAAGVVAGRRDIQRVYDRKWAASEIAEVVARFLLDPALTSTVADYDRWARRQIKRGDEVPSEAHLRQRFGGWKSILDVGLDIIASEGSLEAHAALCTAILEEKVSRRSPAHQTSSGNRQVSRGRANKRTPAFRGSRQ